jgi:tRNA pseudouridine38-40 synthase
MQNWKLILAYDGTPFHGWQIQPDLPTIQGTLAAALLHITGETVLPQGSGRTDTGVHALGQVASVSLACPIPAGNLKRALNHVLPASVRVLAVEAAVPEFHARHRAIRKTYEYRIFPGTGQSGLCCSPMLAPYVWDCPLPLDFETLQAAARMVIGEHDFTSFAAVDPDRAQRNVGPECGAETDAPAHATARRTIEASCWQSSEGLYLYRVTASGFLHHMVRNLVGTFVEAATGRTSVGDISGILAAKDRSAAGPTAPAQGLFLVEVTY